MRTIIFTILLFFFFQGTQKQADAQSINWLTWKQLEQKMETKPKPVYVFIYTPWCGWCKRMQASVLKNPEVIKTLNSRYYPVKFNAENKSTVVFNGNKYNYDYDYPKRKNGTHHLAQKLQQGHPVYPASVFIDKNYKLRYIKKGSSVTGDFLKLLNKNAY